MNLISSAFFSFAVFSAFLIPADECFSSDVSPQIINDSQLQIIWTDVQGSTGKVYLSSLNKKEWTTPLLLHETKDDVFHAVSGIGKNNEIYAVWTEQKRDRYSLVWTRYTGQGWDSPKEINTGMVNNRDSTLVIDDEERVWLAWTSTQGKYSDVFTAFLQGDTWSKAKKVHEDNEVPDIEPQLINHSKYGLILSYLTVVNKVYVEVTKRWTGTGWKELSAANTGDIKDLMYSRYDMRTMSPDFIQEQSAAMLFLHNRNGSTSIPLSQL